MSGSSGGGGGGGGGKKKVDPHAPLTRGLQGLAKMKESLTEAQSREEKAREADAKRRAEVHAREKAAKAEGWKPDRDKEILAVAMSGVTPLGDRGRTVRGGPVGGRSPTRGGAGARGDAGSAMRRAHAEGTDGIAVRWDAEGNCEAARRGREFALEALGRFAAPQDKLDLHGCDVEEARHRVAEFVRTRRARGLRTVCVVHGVGKHALDGTTVLRDAAVKALSEGLGAREVDAFRTAETGVGGAGTLMIALRSGGK